MAQHCIHIRMWFFMCTILVCSLPDILEYLISIGCHVGELAGTSGSTALHYSVSGGHEECVKVLVQYGAEINPLMTNEEV